MYAFLIGVSCCLPLFLSAGLAAASPAGSDDEARSTCQEETSDPAGDLAELLNMIRSTSPGLYRRICRMPRRDLLEAFMKAAGCSVSAESPEAGQSASAERKIVVFPGRLLERKRVFYLRLDGLTRETFISAANELFLSLASSPSAMVLDLRNADCGDSNDEFSQVQSFIELLTKDPKIAPWYGPRPLAVLISGKTSGAAALLALFLSRGGAKALTVGSPASGVCFPVRTGTACGIRWRVPRIPEDLADLDIPIEHLKPAFPVAERAGQIDFKKLADPQAVSADPVLRTSLDLVLSLSVLKMDKMETVK